jgi:hypothetical protein
MTALPLFGDPEPSAPAPVVLKLTEADVLRRLARRYGESHGNGDRWAFATHVRCSAGFGQGGLIRTADAVAMDLWPSTGLEIHGHEVKVSRSDWLAELKQPTKCEPVRRYCDRWWLVVADRSIVKAGELPDGWGLMAVSGERVRVLVKAPKLKPEPIGRDFIAPLLRAAMKTVRREAAR